MPPLGSYSEMSGARGPGLLGGVVLAQVWLKGADIQPELRTAPRKNQDIKGGMRESADRILDFSAHSSHFEHIAPHQSPHFLL